jgi:ComF family protein
MRIAHWLKKYADELLDLIYPRVCFGCKVKLPICSGIYLCEKCLNKVKYLCPPFCHFCGIPVGENIFEEKTSRCIECTSQRYYFKKGYTASIYDNLIKECIHSLKYNSHTYLGSTLGTVMSEYAKKFIPVEDIDLIVPVPLHWKKLRDRGFNQSVVLGSVLAEKTGVMFVSKGISRTKSMPSQVRLSRNERMHNLEGAFCVTKPEYFVNKRLLLVDDVFTTGATMNECARALIKSGAKEVSAFSLARGVTH